MAKLTWTGPPTTAWADSQTRPVNLLWHHSSVKRFGSATTRPSPSQLPSRAFPNQVSYWRLLIRPLSS